METETTSILGLDSRSLPLGLLEVEPMILTTSISTISTQTGEATRKRKINRKTCLISMWQVRHRRMLLTLSELPKEEVI